MNPECVILKCTDFVQIEGVLPFAAPADADKQEPHGWWCRMAEKLEAKPDRMATMEEYRAIVDDHPVKFDEKQVHFERDEGGDHKDGMCCAVCFHFYAGSSITSARFSAPRTETHDSADRLLPFCDAGWGELPSTGRVALPKLG